MRSGLAFGVLLLVIAGGCLRSRHGSAPFEFVENGRKWAHGEVKVGDIARDFGLAVMRKSAGQPFDTYHLSGRVGSESLPLVYVDLHPRQESYLAYVYTVEFRSQDGKQGSIYAVLEKGGRSLNGRQYVHVGTGTFKDQEGEASLTLSQGVHVSEIVDGPFKGHLALHYPDLEKVTSKPWQGLCPRYEGLSYGVSIDAGSTSSGAGVDVCRPLTVENDLCQGEPTRPGCRPKPPVKASISQGEQQYQVENLEKLDVAQSSYALARVSDEGRLEFWSRHLAVTSAEMNRELCAEKFFAIGRTIGDRRNEACVLRPAPAEPKDGFLACAVTIGFEKAQTYMEKICNVTAIFLGPKDEIVKIQVLKR